MNCDQVKESLLEYLLNELDSDTKFAIDLHLDHGCPSCNSYERELVEGIDVLFDALPNDSLSSNQREAILACASNPTKRVHVRFNTAHLSNIHTDTIALKLLLPYTLAFAAGLLLMMSVAPLKGHNKTLDVVELRESTFPSDTFAVDPSTIPKDSEMSEAKYAKTVQVSMHRTNLSSRIEGHIMWDALNNEVHFFGSGVAIPANGMHYVLWLMDENKQALVAKQLSLDLSGRCKATANSRMSSVRYIMITLESKLGSFERPSDNIELTLDAARIHSISL